MPHLLLPPQHPQLEYVAPYYNIAYVAYIILDSITKHHQHPHASKHQHTNIKTLTSHKHQLQADNIRIVDNINTTHSLTLHHHEPSANTRTSNTCTRSTIIHSSTHQQTLGPSLPNTRFNCRTCTQLSYQTSTLLNCTHFYCLTCTQFNYQTCTLLNCTHFYCLTCTQFNYQTCTLLNCTHFYCLTCTLFNCTHFKLPDLHTSSG